MTKLIVIFVFLAFMTTAQAKREKTIHHISETTFGKLEYYKTTNVQFIAPPHVAVTIHYNGRWIKSLNNKSPKIRKIIKTNLSDILIIEAVDIVDFKVPDFAYKYKEGALNYISSHFIIELFDDNKYLVTEEFKSYEGVLDLTLDTDKKETFSIFLGKYGGYKYYVRYKDGAVIKKKDKIELRPHVKTERQLEIEDALLKATK